MHKKNHASTVSGTSASRRSFTRNAATAMALAPIVHFFVTQQSATAATTEATLGDGQSGMQKTKAVRNLQALGEEHPHTATYMAFASDVDGIWEENSDIQAGLKRVRSDLVDVAKAIGISEPVKMLVLSKEEKAIAQDMLNSPSPGNPDVHESYMERPAGVGGIELIVTPDGFNDYWTRDTGAVFVKDVANNNALVGINFNFNGWGNANSVSEEAPDTSNQTKKAAFYQPYENDRRIAATMAARHGAEMLHSSLTLEGGALELDGEGTAILTESSILHVNRNPQLFNIQRSGQRIVDAKRKPNAKALVEQELHRVLGVTKVIWLTGTDIFPDVGVEDETDITNGHVDFYAKFLAPGVVAYASDPDDTMGEQTITERHKRELGNQTDAKERPLQLVELAAPSFYGGGLTASQQQNFAAGYINFYISNGAIILPKFGDSTADNAALKALEPYKGNREIIQVNITGIASGGGGLHCATSQVPE